jgi:hypothetical protein
VVGFVALRQIKRRGASEVTGTLDLFGSARSARAESSHRDDFHHPLSPNSNSNYIRRTAPAFTGSCSARMLRVRFDL